FSRNPKYVEWASGVFGKSSALKATGYEPKRLKLRELTLGSFAAVFTRMTTPTTSVAGTLPAASNPQATSTTTGSSALASAAGSTAATTTTAGIHLCTIAATGGAVVTSAATTMSLQGGFTSPRVPNAAGVASSLPLSTPGVVAPVSMVYGSSVPSVTGVSYGYYGGYGHPVPSSGVPLYPGTRGSGGPF
ncbi:hypothetical protein PF011_g31377, partial [Phytophthora fragariae]